jgi:phosphogluconate dehydratase
MNERIVEITDRIAQRSRDTRASYLEGIVAARSRHPARGRLGCANLAHALAACGAEQKAALRGAERPNIAIISAYNDMLSAHQPLGQYPPLLKRAIGQAGGIAQVAGGVPAMCDGITQGREGMELSLFSREIVAMATVIALAHDVFDGMLLLGVCDKIVPGLLIGALSFGHLPAILVPAGPMPSGLPNREKSMIRQLHAEGKIGRDELLDSELRSYHSPGTCTFYGTANTNQLVVEVMGLHLPGASFINPGTPLRAALTRAAGVRITQLTALGGAYTPLGELVDERAIVNGIAALLATGGSTNHTMHLVAIAAAAGLTVTWEDFADLSAVVPLLARVYPNGGADINQFHAAGGTAYIVAELLDAGLLHPNVRTVAGDGLERYREHPYLEDAETIAWRPSARVSGDDTVLRPVSEPFAADSGLRVLDGPLGRAVIKTSALATEQTVVVAPARVFDSQAAFMDAFDRGELDCDHVSVLRFQGPKANGMPELHKLTPALGLLMDRGYRVALLTDGRMSGASGKVPAAIHCTPEAATGGQLALLRDGDVIRIDAESGRLEVDNGALAGREPATGPRGVDKCDGTGRELFANLRRLVGRPDHGASIFGTLP